MQPEAAIMKMKGLTFYQARSIGQGRWPDGREIQTAPTTTEVAISFSIFNNTLNAEQPSSDNNIIMRPSTPRLQKGVARTSSINVTSSKN